MKSISVIKYRAYYVLFFPLFLTLTLYGQDVEDVADNIKNINRQPLTISGGLNLFTDFYGVSGIDPRRDKFQWQVRTNLNLSFLGINAPFALAFSDGNQQFRLPSYTFTGISPTYKWAQLHLGDRSLNYSKYTLNSINFRGAGFELQPGKFYVSAMYGRLRRAVAEDLNSLQALDPAYQRMGYSAKVGYRTESQEYNIIYFGAYDKENSILQPLNRPITPANNAVISFNTRQRLLKKFTLEVEFARSAFNEDSRTEELPEEDQNGGNTLLGIFNPTTTITTGNAFRSRLNYGGKDFNIQTGYERIGRGFRTMGALFFLSDAEYITIGASKRFFQNKLNVFFNGGIERTNLDEFEKNGTQRFISSLNVNYAPVDRWQFNGSYSNFQNTTKIRAFNDPNQLIDSILLAQTTQTASLVTTHQFAGQRPSMISLILTYQEANSIVDDIIQDDAQSRFVNGSLMYNTSFEDKNLQLNTGLNFNRTMLAETGNTTYSIHGGLNKAWADNKVKTNLRMAYNWVNYDENGSNSVINFLVGASYRFLPGHYLQSNLTVLHRSTTQANQARFWEWYGRIGYTFNFSESLKASKREQEKVKAQPIQPVGEKSTPGYSNTSSPSGDKKGNSSSKITNRN